MKNYANRAENLCAEKLTKMGYTVSKRGWPDFWAFKDGKFLVIECKNRSTARLKKDQKFIMDIFKQNGIRTYKFTPDNGFSSDIV